PNGGQPRAAWGASAQPGYNAATVSEPDSTKLHPATNPPRAVPRKAPNGAPPYAGCTACHSPNATAMSTSALSRADSGGPRRARRNASSSVTSATVVSAIKKKTNGATNPDGADGRSSAMTAASGRSAAPAAAAYQCHS